MTSIREAKLQSVTADIRQLAATLHKDDGKIDKADVKDLLRRAMKDGQVSRKSCEDLLWVREKYKDSFTTQGLAAMNTVLSSFVQDELAKMKEDERKKKIENQLVEIEQRIEYVLKDRKMRDMQIDDKQRTIINDLFGRRARS